MSDEGDEQRLLRRIEERKETVEFFLRSARPRAARLTYITIVSSALAAALTAGPGVGGATAMDQVAGLLGLDSAEGVWRPLCLLAMVVSITAAISANLSRTKNTEARIVNAEACSAELEGLQTLVEFRQVSVEEGVKLYQQYVAKVPFIAEASADRRGPARER